MFNKLKKKIALSWIGSHSNSNQVNINSPVTNNIIVSGTNETLNVLKQKKDYNAIQEYTRQFLEYAKQTHPLYPAYSAKVDSQLNQLVSTPETEEALKKYPKRSVSTLKLDYTKYPYMSKEETPWDYAYRTQTTVILEATAYKEYLGDIEDPFPIVKYQDGLVLGIEPIPFPPAVQAQVKSGDVSLPIMLKRVPCMEYKHLCLEGEAENASLLISITIQQDTNHTSITFTRKYDCDLKKQLLREKLFSNLINNRLIIEVESKELMNTTINRKAFRTDFFKSSEVFVEAIEKLLFIEEKISCRFSSKLSNVNEEEYNLIMLLSASLQNKWFLQFLTFDDRFRCSYQVLTEDVFKDRTEEQELIGTMPDYSFSILGVNFVADKYIVRLRKARLNNKMSVRKNIKRKRDNIMLTFKPSTGFKFFEKYSLIENVRIVPESN